MGGFRSAPDQLLMLITHTGPLCLISAAKKKKKEVCGGGIHAEEQQRATSKFTNSHKFVRQLLFGSSQY